MALQGFDKDYYLGAKLTALQAEFTEWVGKDAAFLEDVLLNVYGLTPEDHYNQWGYTEGLAPNTNFNAAEYKLAKATALFTEGKYISITAAQTAFEAAWPGDSYQHYIQWGSAEGVNPSNSFDESSYLDSKLAALQADSATATEWAGKTAADVRASFTAAGLSALGHFVDFGSAEGLTVTAVPAAEQVSTDGSGTGTTGTTFTLTIETDNLTGTANNDTFVGGIDDNTAANNTLTALDLINGGAGTDTLNAVVDVSGAGVTFPGVTISNVEIINVRNVSGQIVTADTSLWTGMTTVASDRSTGANVFTNIAAGTTVGVIGDGSSANGATTATYVTTATAGLLDFSGGTTAGAVALNGTGLTGLTISSTGASNSIGALSTNSTEVLTTTINATTAFLTTGFTLGTNTGTQSLVVTGTSADVAATSTAAARSAVVLGALDADFASLDASGLSAGGVSATLSATVAATFTGGVGNDTLTTSTSGQTGAVDAGTGTDTLVLGAAGHIDSTAEGALYKGFEVLSSAAAAIDMDLITGSTITAIVLGAAGSNVTDMTATQAANVTAAGALGATTLGIKNATQVGTSDTLTITATDGDTTGSEALVAGGDLTLAGVETVNLVATDDIIFTDMSNITGLTNLNVSGGGDVSFTTLVHVVTTNLAVNCSTLTGTSTFNFAGATTNALSFTGGTNVDTVSSSVVGGNVVSLGAGNDSYTMIAKTAGTTGDIVTGGAGADTITTGALVGTGANDKLTLAYAAGDSVSDSGQTNGVSAALTDFVTGIDSAAATAAAGNVVEFDTEVQASAVTFSATAVTFGTTTVTNAFDFYVMDNNANTANEFIVYQDTDGDKIIESGEFAVRVLGSAQAVTGEFAIATGDLLMTTA